MRKSIVDKVWEEEGPAAPVFNPTISASGAGNLLGKAISMAAPPVPPRRGSSRVGSLWEKGLGALGVDVVNGRSPSTVIPAMSQRDKPLPPPLPVRSPSRPTVSISPKSPFTQLPEMALSTTDPKEEINNTLPNGALGLNEDKANVVVEVPKHNDDGPEMVAVTAPAGEPEANSVIGGTVDLNEDVKEAGNAAQSQPPAKSGSPIDRPATPRSVALPTSAPTTPTRRPAPLPPPTTPGSTPGAPPPVPRRAAARRAVPPAPGSRTGTPSPRTSMSMMANKDREFEARDPKRGSMGQTIDSSINATAEGSPLKKTFDERSRPSTPTPVRNSSRPSTPINAPSTSSFAAAPSSRANTVTALPATSATEGLSSSAVQENPSVERSAVAEAAQSPPDPALAPPLRLPDEPVQQPTLQPNEPPESNVEAAFTVEASEAQAPDSPVDENIFVSDKSWEERAWKELVRLRADMFWARIGSVAAGRDM